jgi:hypothetical protein
MIGKWTMSALIALAAWCAFAAGAFASDEEYLDLKSFHVNMTEAEMTAHLADYCYREACAFSRQPPFTVGGIKGKLVRAAYGAHGTIDFIEFGFDSVSFLSLQRALTQRYPDVDCANSDATTTADRPVAQVVCRFETDRDGIYLVRVADNLDTSILFVTAIEKRSAARDLIAAASKDL